MMMRKTIALLTLIAAGCQSGGGGGGQSSNEEDVKMDPVTRIIYASQLAYDPASVKLGQSVRYTAKVNGESGTWLVKYSAVAQDPGGIWIENKVPFQDGSMVIKSKYARDGKLAEQWAGQPGSPKPAKIYPPQDKSEPKKETSSQSSASTKESAETVEVGGRTYACTKVTTTLTFSGGRTSTMMSWYSPEVPFSLQKYGGLVKRQCGPFTMELTGIGQSGAQSELELPK